MCICNIKAAFFALKWAFFIRLPHKKIRRATRPTDKFFQELFFIKLFFELFLLLLHKLHKFLQGADAVLSAVQLCAGFAFGTRLFLRLQGLQYPQLKPPRQEAVQLSRSKNGLSQHALPFPQVFQI